MNTLGTYIIHFNVNIIFLLPQVELYNEFLSFLERNKTKEKNSLSKYKRKLFKDYAVVRKVSSHFFYYISDSIIVIVHIDSVEHFILFTFFIFLCRFGLTPHCYLATVKFQKNK